MNVAFVCECGIKTREPFMVDGVMMCAVCADREAPRLVDKRAARNWMEFQNMSRRVPTKPYYRNRWADDES